VGEAVLVEERTASLLAELAGTAKKRNAAVRSRREVHSLDDALGLFDTTRAMLSFAAELEQRSGLFGRQEGCNLSGERAATPTAEVARSFVGRERQSIVPAVCALHGLVGETEADARLRITCAAGVFTRPDRLARTPLCVGDEPERGTRHQNLETAPSRVRGLRCLQPVLSFPKDPEVVASVAVPLLAGEFPQLFGLPLIACAQRLACPLMERLCIAARAETQGEKHRERTLNLRMTGLKGSSPSEPSGASALAKKNVCVSHVGEG
jgi:hypothetical protein